MARVLSAAGARDTEELLLQALDEDQIRVAADPAALARPLRVVVPSRSLRDHLSARISRRRGAVAGVAVETHLQLAHAILREHGEPAGATQDALLDLLIRRRADADPRLSEVLGELQLGYRAVIASAGDLLHADLDPRQDEVLEDLMASLGQGPRGQRAAAVIGASLHSLTEFAQAGRLTRDDLLRRAGLLLRDGESESLGRGLIVHGFADATGVVTTFLEHALRHPQSLLLLDRPRDPAHPERVDLGVEFSRPFGLRLGETARSETAPAGTSEPGAAGGTSEPGAAAGTPAVSAPAELSWFTAPGSRAEAREIARRIRARLDESDAPPPEGIAVVARSFGSRLQDLRESFTDYGIPWQSPEAKNSVDPTGRRLLALRELLRKGGRCPVSRWFEARGEELSGWRERLAVGVLGVGRLGQLPDLDCSGPLRGKARLALPHRHGFYLPDGAPPGVARVGREHLSTEVLEELQGRARTLLDRIAQLEGIRSFAEHAELTLEIARTDLGWAKKEHLTPAMTRWEELLDTYPPDFELSGEEFLTLLHEAIDRSARPRTKRDGGGVRVLDLTQARALAFDHIYVMGLNRGNFPPSAKEDPLLPDAMRAQLRAVMPELKSKLDRSREERFLFAQLLSSAPSLTLSWWSTDDDGRATPPSPFVQRLRLGEEKAPPAAPATLELEFEPGFARPLREHLLEAALANAPDRFTELLGASFTDQDTDAPPPEHPQGLAETASRVLREYDCAPQKASDLGPWMGLLPPRVDELADPRASDFHVTALERLAGCPWSWVLERVLGLEPTPDPLGALPGLQPRWVGSVVHGALERIIESVTGRHEDADLAQLAGEGIEIPWPAQGQLEAWTLDAAKGVLDGEGLALPGLAHALAIRAQVHLEECRRLLFEKSGPFALGSEIRDEARVQMEDGRVLRVPFRTDLVDRVDGQLRLLDFKTGGTFADAVRADTIRTKVLDAIASGQHLQGMAYALAAERVEGRAGRGSYLFLKPDQRDEKRWVEMTSDDEEMLTRFQKILSLLDLLKHGGFLPPRLIDLKSGKEPSRCGYCEVSSACVRGDSTSRQREESWFERLRERNSQGDTLSGDETLLLQAWELSGRQS